MAELTDYLNAINHSKANPIRTSVMPDAEEKAYPRWPIQKIMAHHADAILWVNELNCRGMPSHGISNRQHFEFLLHSLDARKRFAPYIKPEKNATIELIKNINRFSDRKAREVVDLLSARDLELYQESMNEGGSETTPRRKKKEAVVNESKPKTGRSRRRLED